MHYIECPAIGEYGCLESMLHGITNLRFVYLMSDFSQTRYFLERAFFFALASARLLSASNLAPRA